MKTIIYPLSKSDLPVLIKWAEDEKTLIQWCGPVFDFPLTIEQLKNYYSESEKNNPSRYLYKAVIDNNIIAGMCELGRVDIKNETAALCRIFVDKKYRGSGIAEEMISHLLDFGFGKLNLIRIELNVYTFNTAAIKCYEKLGFLREGLKRKDTKCKNEYWDSYVYGLLKDEWDSVKTAKGNQS